MRGWDFWIMSLARELHMTRKQLLENTDSVELTMWREYFKEVNSDKPKKQSKAEVEGSIKNFMAMRGKKKR